MAEPDNIVREHLHAIRAKLDDIERKLDGAGCTARGKSDAGRLAEMALKLDGLAFMMAASFDAVIRRLEGIDLRLSRLSESRA